VHYHVPRQGLDEIARDHKIKPVGTYKFGICEDDLVIAQLTKNTLPHVGSAEWTSPLALKRPHASSPQLEPKAAAVSADAARLSFSEDDSSSSEDIRRTANSQERR
jgi:hypothetical protein